MYIGDFPTGSTITIEFNTHDSTGALVAMAGSPLISIETGGSDVFTGLTPTAVATGRYSVSVPFGTTITAAHDYWARLTAGTIDGVTAADMLVARFSCQNRYNPTAAGVNVTSINSNTQAASNLALMTNGSGIGAKLTLTQLKIYAEGTDNAIDVTSQYGRGLSIVTGHEEILGGSGIYVTSNGDNAMLLYTTAATAKNGLAILGTSHGLRVLSNSGGSGIYATGNGVGDGMRLTGGTSGYGLNADIHGSLDGSVASLTGYIAPDNTTIGLINAKTTNLPAIPASQGDVTGAVTSVNAHTDVNLDAKVSTRMATFTYVAPDNATITLINNKTTNLPSDPADQSAVESAISASEATIVAAIGTAGAGTGSIEWGVTIEDTSNNPLDGCQVILKTLGGELVAGGFTNAMGVATFYLDPGTYQMIRNLSGYSFVNPVEVTVS